MRHAAAAFFSSLGQLCTAITVTDSRGADLGLGPGLEAAANMAAACSDAGGKLLFIGNGASAAIASHMSTDFWKTGGMRSQAFNDPALLTCMGNDYGYPHVFEKPVEMFADPGDVLVAISSSGRSENILRAVDAARARGCRVLTLSGFALDNPLRGRGDINVHVPISAYGPVEVLHHGVCHCVLDILVAERAKS